MKYVKYYTLNLVESQILYFVEQSQAPALPITTFSTCLKKLEFCFKDIQRAFGRGFIAFSPLIKSLFKESS